jgi:hypothetical protein
MSHSRVYERDAFAYRVNFAAGVIAKGGNTTRNFDTCCEMNDGDAVVAALMQALERKQEAFLRAVAGR